MANILAELEKQSNLPSTSVERENNLIYDLGNLTAFDPKPIDSKAFSLDAAEHLKEVARDNVQLLFNKIFALPTEKATQGVNGVIATLPEPTTEIPREKPVPKAKPLTKWEKFAKEKGIKKRKSEGRMVYDEVEKDYKPRWGYNKANVENDWIIEAKPGDDSKYEDPYEAKAAAKKQKIEKQKKHEVLNKATAEKKSLKKLPSTIALTNNFSVNRSEKKEDINATLKIAQRSTISMGKFDKVLRNEKPVKEKKNYDPLIKAGEKEQTMKLLNRVLKENDGPVDIKKAVNATITEHQKTKKAKKQAKR